MVMNLEESGAHADKPVDLPVANLGIQEMVGAEFFMSFLPWHSGAFFRQRAKPKKNQQENVMRIS